MKFRDLKKHLLNGERCSAYIITGDDAYVIKGAVELFKKQISLMPELNIAYFYDSSQCREIIEACEVLPVMNDVRLILAFDYKGDCDPFAEYLNKPNLSTMLVFVSPVLKENFSKIISKLTPVDCNKLDEENILKFILKKVEELNSSIERDAAVLLTEYCSFNLSRISTETEKLAGLKFNDMIKIEDVESQVTPDTEYKIYELSEAVADKNNERAAKVLKSFFESKIEPTFILGALYSHFRRLLYCLINAGAPDLAILLGVKEYAVKKSAFAAAKYTPLRLKKICDGFHKADFSFKSGEITDILALEIFIMQILQEK